MYRKYATPLRFELQASGYTGRWLLLTHLAGLVVLPFTAQPVWVMGLLATVVVASLRWCWPRYVSRRHRGAVRVFTWQEGNNCVVEQTGGKISSGQLNSRAFVMPWLVILYYRQGKRCRSLFVVPDMLSHETFRRLRVRLRTAMIPPVKLS